LNRQVGHLLGLELIYARGYHEISGMKIRYLNGNRLFYAFLAGGEAVIQDQSYLNKINVFPVPDADTGSNLASTMRSISQGASAHRSIKETLRSIADTALTGARGNSGIIFAQFLEGFRREVQNEEQLSTQTFGEAVNAAVNYAYQAMASPVEGTMLTVIRDWANAVYEHRTRLRDFSELLSYSLRVARQSLKDTPKKLRILAKAGVVDAGAKGFVDFLEGIVQFITRGKLAPIPDLQAQATEVEFPPHTHRSAVEQRYCTEALLVGEGIPLDRIREDISRLGSSAIVAGSENKARIHVHTDLPAELFSGLRNHGITAQVKVDDMRRQFEAAYARKYKYALLTDSACDLPQAIQDEFQIHVIPFTVSFGENLYLDKVTLTSERFYRMLETEKEHPTTSQPLLGTVQNMLRFLSDHYEQVFALFISDGLTGLYKTAVQAVSGLDRDNIHPIDTHHISVSEGLIVLRVAEAIRDGRDAADILAQVQDWIAKTLILVDVATMKYFVRGGRVSPLKGLVARLLHVKPIITLNESGSTTAFAKSFNRRMTMDKILKGIERWAEKGPVWNYSLVHALDPERAQAYIDRLRTMLHKDPVFVMEVSPVIGTHSGIGALGIAAMRE
jgi:DegV family protein with EDD domain